jgi:hypothetical protein
MENRVADLNDWVEKGSLEWHSLLEELFELETQMTATSIRAPLIWLLVWQGAARLKIGLSRSESINHRHADFQSGVGMLLAFYFNKLAGRPLPNLQDNA